MCLKPQLILLTVLWNKRIEELYLETELTVVQKKRVEKLCLKTELFLLIVLRTEKLEELYLETELK